MTVLEILGLLGGTLYLIEAILGAIIKIHKEVKSYYMRLGANEERDSNAKYKEPKSLKMGFKTREEELEDEIKLLNTELDLIKENKRA